jgi:tetratricopeptide (TPR) repeat protein
VNYVAFSPDGRRVVTASDDRTARVWDTATGQPLSTPLKHEGGVLHAAFSPDGRRIVTASRDRTARVWNISTDDRDAGDLILLAHLLSGSRVETRGALVPLTSREFRDAWQALGKKYPGDFVASDRDVLAWHRREADDCEAKQVWDSAIKHLDCMIASEPDQGELYARRGNAYAVLGRWDLAAADYSKAGEIQAGDLKMVDLARLAYIRLAMNDVGTYRQACAELLDLHGRLENPEDVLYWVPMTCALGPDAVADPEAVVRLAQRALKASKTVAGLHIPPLILGAATYRAGRFEEAIKYLTQGEGGYPQDCLFLAMAHQRLGHTAEARQWLDKAIDWIDSSTKDKPKGNTLGARIDWQTWLELQVLRREAESLIKGSKADAPPVRP